MQEPISVSGEGAEPNIHHMLMLVDEAKVAAHTLAKIVPNPEVIQGLYQYLWDALETIEEGLMRLKARS